MTKRWERELRTLNDIPAPLERIRDRAGQGPNGIGDLDLPPRRQRIVAGVVAFAVFAAVGAFAWRAFDLAEPPNPGDTTKDLPVLSVTFESAGLIGDAPDSSTRRVDTFIDYGDAHEENFTSTTPDNAIVEWVGVDDVTPFVPGPTAGSAVSMTADGQDPRVLLGAPQDWPNFGRFERIDRLPPNPGDYVLLFEADYPEGTAMTARRVHVVGHDVLQLSLIETSKQVTAHATAYVDGEGVDGFLSKRHYLVGGDMVVGSMRGHPPVFQDDRRLLVTDGTTIVFGGPADEATAGLFENYEETPDRLPIDLIGNEPTLSSATGTFLLAVDAVWTRDNVVGSVSGTRETVRFFFPIEVMPASDPTSPPTPASETQLEAEGTSFVLPQGWQGSEDSLPGYTRRIFQVATFSLPPLTDIAAMDARASIETDDVLIVMHEFSSICPPCTSESSGLPIVLGPQDQEDATQVPKWLPSLTDVPPDHGLARRIFNIGPRYFDLFVEFGSVPVTQADFGRVNTVLGSLTIGDWIPESNEVCQWEELGMLDPDCPEPQWLREVLTVAGFTIGDEAGTFVARSGGAEFFIWVEELGQIPQEQLALLDDFPIREVINGVSVYGNSRGWQWSTDELHVYIQDGPYGDSELPDIEQLTPLVEASINVAYPLDGSASQSPP